MYRHSDQFATLPVDLDPDRHGIICRHFFDIDPEDLRQLRCLIALFDEALHALAVETGGNHA